MQTFTFEAYGKTFKIQGKTALSVMEDANRELLWGNKQYSQGAWSDGPTEFRWIEGNFFD